MAIQMTQQRVNRLEKEVAELAAGLRQEVVVWPSQCQALPELIYFCCFVQ